MTQTETQGRMLTVMQAAREVNVHPNTIRNWIREGRLRAEPRGNYHALHVAETELVAVALTSHWATVSGNR